MENMNEIAALLHIHKEASSYGTTLQNISSAAMKALRDIDADYAPKPEEVRVGVPPEPVKPGDPVKGGHEVEPPAATTQTETGEGEVAKTATETGQASQETGGITEPTAPEPVSTVPPVDRRI